MIFNWVFNACKKQAQTRVHLCPVAPQWHQSIFSCHNSKCMNNFPLIKGHMIVISNGLQQVKQSIALDGKSALGGSIDMSSGRTHAL